MNGISYIALVMLAVVSVPLFICLIRSDNYDEFASAVDSSKIGGAKYLGIGFAMLDLIKMDFHNIKYTKRREEAGILFGKKFADFYLRVLYAQAFTYSLLIMYAVLFLSCLVGGTDGLLLSVMGIIAAAAIYVYYLDYYKNKIEKLSEEYMLEFPGAVSAIALLVNGGVFLRDAWRDVAFSSDKPLYIQMRKVLDDMNNGYSEADAISMFADRCATKDIRKFSSMIVQAITKGGKDLADQLVKQSDALLIEKQNLVMQQGEKASNKLMIPIMLVFAGILIMIMMPIMSTMSV